MGAGALSAVFAASPGPGQPETTRHVRICQKGGLGKVMPGLKRPITLRKEVSMLRHKLGYLILRYPITKRRRE